MSYDIKKIYNIIYDTSSFIFYHIFLRHILLYKRNRCAHGRLPFSLLIFIEKFTNDTETNRRQKKTWIVRFDVAVFIFHSGATSSCFRGIWVGNNSRVLALRDPDDPFWLRKHSGHDCLRQNRISETERTKGVRVNWRFNVCRRSVLWSDDNGGVSVNSVAERKILRGIIAGRRVKAFIFRGLICREFSLKIHGLLCRGVGCALRPFSSWIS